MTTNPPDESVVSEEAASKPEKKRYRTTKEQLAEAKAARDAKEAERKAKIAAAQAERDKRHKQKYERKRTLEMRVIRADLRKKEYLAKRRKELAAQKKAEKEARAKEVAEQAKRLEAQVKPGEATVEVAVYKDGAQPVKKATPVEKELAARVLARRKLLHFVSRFHGSYTPGWVHEDICRRLERFLQDVADKKSPRLLLMMPPRTGKSEIASRKFPAWALGQYPDLEIIAASHTQSLAMNFSRHIRDLLRDPAYQAIFEKCRLDPDSQSVESWNTTSGGGYMAAGVGTGITGRGANILIIDDPVKDMEAADSPTIRDNTWEWYLSTAFTRLAPGGGVLGIMTWWNDDDWGGRIQLASASGDGEKFEVVRYAAINEGYDEYLGEDGTIYQVYPNEEVPEKAALLRPSNTALHEERYTLEYLTRIKKNFYATGQGRVWAALYQQNPAPEEGAFFTKEMFRWYGSAPHHSTGYIYQAWDFAITEKEQSDWTVCATILQDPHDNLYVLEVQRFRTGDSFVIVDAILDNYERWGAHLLGVEDGQIWKSIRALYEKRCLERRLYPSLEVLQPLTDKLVRAGPLRGRMQMGKIYFPSEATWKQDCVQELLRFPAGKHDDQVDGLAWAVRLTLSKAAPRLKEPVKIKGWRDRLHEITGGGVGTSHMAA